MQLQQARLLLQILLLLLLLVRVILPWLFLLLLLGGWRMGRGDLTRVRLDSDIGATLENANLPLVVNVKRLPKEEEEQEEEQDEEQEEQEEEEGEFSRDAESERREGNLEK